MARWGEQAENPSIPACYLILEKPDGEWLFVLREDTASRLMRGQSERALRRRA
jgi:hypothetical protein